MIEKKAFVIGFKIFNEIQAKNVLYRPAAEEEGSKWCS